MSNVTPGVATCPRCRGTHPVTLFESVHGDALTAQADLIVEGTFERTRCPRCDQAFRPEHRMLYAHFGTRTWVVMYPFAERADFVALERAVGRLLSSQFAQAPAAVAEQLAGVRPRLVFGQHMLGEAVRLSRLGVAAPLLECAKLVAMRDHLSQLFPHGPTELCFERFDDGGALVCGVHALSTGERVDELAVAGDRLAEVRAAQPAFEAQYPDLFQQPYVSATRYLFGDGSVVDRGHQGRR